ncbi:hypothetical protein ACFLSA_04740 [Bacteroidota bacterium]
MSEPKDGTDYIIDNDLSNGYALVKADTGLKSFSFTGLSENTTYYFEI